MCPDVTIALNFSLVRLNSVIKNLIIYPSNIKKNLDKLKGLHFSQNVMLKLISKGLLREDVYSLVQRNAMKTWGEIGKKSENSFLYFLSKDKIIRKTLSIKDLKEIFNNSTYLKNISVIYKRLFKN